MDSVQKLFVPGSNHSSGMEKVGDAILSFPAFLWRGKTITVVNSADQDPQVKAESSVNTSFTELFRNAKGPAFVGALALTPFYLIGCVVALPFLAVGTLFKKIGLADDKSKSYNTWVAKSVDQLSLNSKIDNIKARINDFQSEIDSVEKKIADNWVNPEKNDFVVQQLKLSAKLRNERDPLVDKVANLSAKKELLDRELIEITEKLNTQHK